MGSDDTATGGAGARRVTVELTVAKLDLLIHMAANGVAMIDIEDKEDAREILQELKGVLDGSA